MKAQAAYGQVLLNGFPLEEGVMMRRDDAVALIKELANAVQQSGDISDPRAVNFATAVQQAVEEWFK